MRLLALITAATAALSWLTAGCARYGFPDDADPCEGIDCSGHGRCAVADEGPWCACDAGYHNDGPLGCVRDDAGLCGSDADCPAFACLGGACTQGRCALQPLPDGTACDDGDPCTERDACTSGACRGSPLDCDDGEPCTLDVCQAGICDHAALPDGATCDDGSFCTRDDACEDGACRGTPFDCGAVDIGDPASEDGHDVLGWSEVWTWGGTYGGGDDGTLRCVVPRAPGCQSDDAEAFFSLFSDGPVAELWLRHLDGQQDDSYEIGLRDSSSTAGWTALALVDRIDEVCSGSECWYTERFDLAGRQGRLDFRIRASIDPIPDWCETWGVNAFSWARLQ
ncbi:MAG: hypothetical protein JXR96_10870 [Deltaproteobacteria bacterium]|nr:hypothetical protein [Deltaproteobacteria bacterium]